jgi:anti-sigma factor (TIGR02949 family)
MIHVECARYREQLDDFLCGELLVETSQEILRHLAQCPECREAFERSQDLRRRLARVVTAEAPESLRARILGQIDVAQSGMAGARQPSTSRTPQPVGARDASPTPRFGTSSICSHLGGVRRLLENVIAGVTARSRPSRSPVRVALTSRVGFAGAVLVLAVFAVLLVSDSGSGTLSAAEVLRRADDHLTELLKPGQVLYCRWHTSYVVRAGGSPPLTVSYVREEWAEGSASGRLAGRWILPDGRLALAVWMTPESGGLRARWFNAGLLPSLTEPDPEDHVPAVYVWPNDQELGNVAAGYPERDRESLIESVRLQEPIVGHQAMYRFLMRSARSQGLDATAVRVRLSNGRPGIRVTARVPNGSFSSFRGHPFRRIPASFTGTWYFDAESYLINRLEREWVTRNGCVIHGSFRLEATSVIPGSDSSLPFTFTPPEGTPEFAVDATELLKSTGATMRPIGRSDSAGAPTSRPKSIR